MSEKQTVIVVSDLHVGGGKADPGDDHVFDENQFCSFLSELSHSSDGVSGDIELFINGDFLEFAQTNETAYQINSTEAWCSEQESLEKLESIIAGHKPIFDAMRQFRKSGNKITIAAGNHDVDLFWPVVQKRIKEEAGEVSYALGEEWYSRFGGKLRISHGHQYDPANRFQHWNNPYTSNSPDGVKRLEMCPGTFFMVHFLNALEKKYPFADNIKPLGALAKLLLKDDTRGAAPFIWMIAKLSVSHPGVTLSMDEPEHWVKDFPGRVVSLMRTNSELGVQIRTWYRIYIDNDPSDRSVEMAIKDEDTLYSLLMAVMANLERAEWMKTMSKISLHSELLGTDEGTLGLARSLTIDDKAQLRLVAKELIDRMGAQVVVMGHTHKTDHLSYDDGGEYFNPGSWTRNADQKDFENFTIESLRDESRFPYQLNYVQIKSMSDGLIAQLITYREKKGGM